MGLSEFTIAKLDCKAGDTLVVKGDFLSCSSDTMVHVHAYFRNGIPEGVKLLLIDKNTDLSVISPVRDVVHEDATVREPRPTTDHPGGHL